MGNVQTGCCICTREGEEQNGAGARTKHDQHELEGLASERPADSALPLAIDRQVEKPRRRKHVRIHRAAGDFRSAPPSAWTAVHAAFQTDQASKNTDEDRMELVAASPMKLNNEVEESEASKKTDEDRMELVAASPMKLNNEAEESEVTCRQVLQSLAMVPPSSWAILQAAYARAGHSCAAEAIEQARTRLAVENIEGSAVVSSEPEKRQKRQKRHFSKYYTRNFPASLPSSGVDLYSKFPRAEVATAQQEEPFTASSSQDGLVPFRKYYAEHFPQMAPSCAIDLYSKFPRAQVVVAEPTKTIWATPSVESTEAEATEECAADLEQCAPGKVADAEAESDENEGEMRARSNAQMLEKMARKKNQLEGIPPCAADPEKENHALPQTRASTESLRQPQSHLGAQPFGEYYLENFLALPGAGVDLYSKFARAQVVAAPVAPQFEVVGSNDDGLEAAEIAEEPRRQSSKEFPRLMVGARDQEILQSEGTDILKKKKLADEPDSPRAAALLEREAATDVSM